MTIAFNGVDSSSTFDFEVVGKQRTAIQPTAIELAVITSSSTIWGGGPTSTPFVNWAQIAPNRPIQLRIDNADTRASIG